MCYAPHIILKILQPQSLSLIWLQASMVTMDSFQMYLSVREFRCFTTCCECQYSFVFIMLHPGITIWVDISLVFSQRPLVTTVLVIRMDSDTCYRCIKCTTRQQRVCSVMPFLCVKNKAPQKFASWWCTKHVMETGVDMVQWFW